MCPDWPRDAMLGGGMLVLRTEQVQLAPNQVGTLAAGEYARTVVADDGEGMTEEVLVRAFEAFFTTKEIGKGTGLGLSQVYCFIVQSGGEVVLQSQLGKGTSISLYLPVVAGTVSQRPSEEIVETVLMVEDEAELLDLAASLFRSIGYYVLTANNGADAIEALKRTAGRCSSVRGHKENQGA